jgi:hypothetical protein
VEDVMLCEKCGQEMEMGYGLAGGGGIGPYFYCSNEACEDPKLVKFKDAEMEQPDDATPTHRP